MALAPRLGSMLFMPESIWFADTLARIHVTPEETAGTYALIEVLAPAGHTCDPHLHTADSEGLFVLEGELTLHTGEGETTIRPGETAHIPSGMAHTLCVTSVGPARVLLVSAPGEFAHFLREAGVPAEREALPPAEVHAGRANVERAAAAHGMRMLVPVS